MIFIILLITHYFYFFLYVLRIKLYVSTVDFATNFQGTFFILLCITNFEKME